MILYIPANLLPITLTTALGKTEGDTIMQGVIYFLFSDHYFFRPLERVQRTEAIPSIQDSILASFVP